MLKVKLNSAKMAMLVPKNSKILMVYQFPKKRLLIAYQYDAERLKKQSLLRNKYLDMTRLTYCVQRRFIFRVILCERHKACGVPKKLRTKSLSKICF